MAHSAKIAHHKAKRARKAHAKAPHLHHKRAGNHGNHRKKKLA